MKDAYRTHSQRILAVLSHIQFHLDEELGLEALSQLAGFSPFHFHRIFLAATGETVGAHVRRLRLARAAYRLEFSDTPVTEIGFEAGYRACEAFSRAFKTHYGEPPGLFRENSKLRRRRYVRGMLPDPEAFLNPQAAGAHAMDVSAVRKEPLRVVCMRATGPYMESGWQAWEKMRVWGAPLGIFGPRAMLIGIGHDDPGITNPRRIRYDACVSVGPEFQAHGEAFTATIPGGDFAVAVHKGPYEDLEKSYIWLYGSWLAQSGREPDARPCYEVYLNDPETTAPGDLLTEINLPLTPGERPERT